MYKFIALIAVCTALGSCTDGHVLLSPGITGPQGAAGPSGATGSQGQQGVPGSNGADATPTTIIQLCGSCIATYPSQFPEIGLCIAGKLYGVYSANGGFLVYLPDGSYSSNGINCSCSFAVSGCEVTP